MIMVFHLVIYSLALQLVNAGCPIYCLCHEQSIDCSHGQLRYLPNDLLSQVHPFGTFGSPILPDQNPPYTSLNLAHNLIEELPLSLLSERLPSMQKLDLSNNKISKITSVQSVLLSKQLLYFSLSSNPISTLGSNPETVLYSESISVLDLSKCTITSITNAATFMFMMNLTHVDLSGNPLVVVDHFMSTSLTHLDLSNCLLGDKGIREESFLELPKLQLLNISMNAQLTRFPLLKVLSKTVATLDASYCAFEKLDLRSFPNLQTAKLRGNIIKLLHNGMLSANADLKVLDLSENSIHHIEGDAFKGARSINVLDLSLNYLSQMDWKALGQCPDLKTLNISRNLLTALEEIAVSTLVTLDASRCDIYKLSPRFLAKSYELRNLNLSHNSIEKLPRRLASRKLLNLDLSYCRLSDLQYETFEDLSSLNSLNLMGNRLTTLIKGIYLDQLVHLEELHLLNNPWHCDCNDNDLRKLWKYPSSHPFKDEYFKNVICHSPKEYSGLSLERNCFENFTNHSHNLPKHGAWFSVLVPLLTLCCLLAIMLAIRQAYQSHAFEVQEREIHNQRSSRSHSQITAPHDFDEDLERGIQMSVNESTHRSAIAELSKLPSYDEALLLPKPQSREDLKHIIKSYEERGRFGHSALQEQESQVQSSDTNYGRNPEDRPSTSGDNYNIPNT